MFFIKCKIVSNKVVNNYVNQNKIKIFKMFLDIQNCNG